MSQGVLVLPNLNNGEFKEPAPAQAAAQPLAAAQSHNFLFPSQAARNTRAGRAMWRRSIAAMLEASEQPVEQYNVLAGAPQSIVSNNPANEFLPQNDQFGLPVGNEAPPLPEEERNVETIPGSQNNPKLKPLTMWKL